MSRCIQRALYSEHILPCHMRVGLSWHTFLIVRRHEDENQMSCKTEIHPAKNLSSERRSELAQWFEEEFGHIPFQWTSPNWYVLALSDSTLIGRLGIIERKASVNGKLLEVAEISGVITHSEW